MRGFNFFASLPRVVMVLGATSLLNDVASDMIAPLLPLFLTVTLGAGPAVVGLVEGLAEATASILKLVSGRLADRGWNQKALVLGGYGVSNATRPLIGIAAAWSTVLLLRFLDRVGKGLRTAPRDAVISASVATEIRGRAFGFHRAMDHTGAMLGPLFAFFLLQGGFDMGHVFLVSAVPGVAVVLLLIFGLRPTAPRIVAEPPPLRWKLLDPHIRGLVLASGGLALAAAPDAFLVLWAQARGLEIVWIPLIWVAAHAVKALVAMPAGALSDRLGRLPVVTMGWAARIGFLVLLAAVEDGALLVWLLFLGYGAALAFSEGAERALVGDFAPPEQKATAFGIYHLVSGILALPGAALFGVLWQWISMEAAFLTAAALTTVAAASLLVLIARLRRHTE